MALEALSNAIAQAGRDYFNASRQDRLLSDERVREDAVYQRKLADQIAAEKRADDRQIAAENRAEKFRKDAEVRAEQTQKDREMRNFQMEIRRLEETAPLAARNKIREKLAELTGNTAYLDKKAISDQDIATTFDAVMQDVATRDRARDIQTQIDTVENQTALGQAKEKTFFNNMAVAEAKVAQAANALKDYNPAKLKEVEGMYAKILAEEVLNFTGGVAPGTAGWKKMLEQNKLDPKTTERQLAALPLVQAAANKRFNDDVKAAAAGGDPRARALLENYQSAVLLTNDVYKAGMQAGIDWGRRGLSEKTTGSPTQNGFLGGAANADNISTEPEPPAPGGVMSPDALKSSMGVSTPAPVSEPAPATAPGSSPSVAPVAPAPSSATPSTTYFAPTGQPAPASGSPAAPAKPAWWSRDRDPAANQQAVIDFVRSTPDVFFQPAAAAARLANPVNYRRGRAGEAPLMYDPNERLANLRATGSASPVLPNISPEWQATVESPRPENFLTARVNEAAANAPYSEYSPEEQRRRFYEWLSGRR